MRDGIEIGPWTVRLTLLAVVGGLAALAYGMLPEARRYLKIESM